jgi:hypothetical protein
MDLRLELLTFLKASKLVPNPDGYRLVDHGGSWLKCNADRDTTALYDSFFTLAQGDAAVADVNLKMPGRTQLIAPSGRDFNLSDGPQLQDRLIATGKAQQHG